ncbi:unnamed protein product, partial [marine sediment metagenome]
RAMTVDADNVDEAREALRKAKELLDEEFLKD